MDDNEDIIDVISRAVAMTFIFPIDAKSMTVAEMRDAARNLAASVKSTLDINGYYIRRRAG